MALTDKVGYAIHEVIEGWRSLLSEGHQPKTAYPFMDSAESSRIVVADPDTDECAAFSLGMGADSSD